LTGVYTTAVAACPRASLAGIIRLYRAILSRAHWGGPLADGQRPVETPEQAVARLVAGGFLKEPEIMKIVRQRQREFQRQFAEDYPGAN
jgi:hypothetical protein